MSLVEFELGAYTEAIWREVVDDISDVDLDSVQIARKLGDLTDLASEPITVAIIVSGVVIIRICGVIDRFLENRRQQISGEFLIRAAEIGKEEREAMAALQTKHAEFIRYSPLSSTEIPALVKLLDVGQARGAKKRLK